MSLDVYLTSPRQVKCQQCGKESDYNTESGDVYSANITHNLGRMAAQAGIYEHLWRPDEIGVTTAAQLIEPVRKGLALMLAYPERFKSFDSPNGWGRYENFIPWIRDYLAACEENPTALVSVSR